MNVQYRLVVSKSVERVEGPDDAAVVITVAAADAGVEPAVAFMRGRLKSTGPTGALLDVLRSGQAAAAIGRLALG